jgi:hypothetical protein
MTGLNVVVNNSQPIAHMPFGLTVEPNGASEPVEEHASARQQV